MCAEGAADAKDGVGRMTPDCLISNGMVQNSLSYQGLGTGAGT